VNFLKHSVYIYRKLVLFSMITKWLSSVTIMFTMCWLTRRF